LYIHVQLSKVYKYSGYAGIVRESRELLRALRRKTLIKRESGRAIRNQGGRKCPY
jgi:hypothetical protein